MMMGQHWLQGDEQFYASINVDTLLIHGRHDRLISLDDTQLMHQVHVLQTDKYTVYSTKGGAMDLRSLGCGFDSYRRLLRNNLGQVVHTYVPLSPSSITWYWSKDGDVLWLGRRQQAWWKVMGWQGMI